MTELDCAGAINSFLGTSDAEGAAPVLSQSDSQGKKKREQIFEEINHMVSYVKRLEF